MSSGPSSFSRSWSARRLVGDDDRDLVEGGRERHRDRRERLARRAPRSGGGGEPRQGAGAAGAAAAFGHGARILGAVDAVARPRTRRLRGDGRRRATGSTSSTGAGRPTTADPARRPARPRPGPDGLDWAPVARRLVADRRTSWRWTCAATACRTRRPRPRRHDLVLAEDVVAVAEGSGLLAPSRRPGRPRRARVRGDRRGRGRPSALGDRCAGLVLVDGGWEDLEAATGHGRRRVPARPRRAARGDALARRVPGGPRRLRPGDAGTPTRNARRGRRSSRPTPGGSCRRRGRTRSRPASGRCSRTTRSATLAAVGGARRRPDGGRRRDGPRVGALAAALAAARTRGRPRADPAAVRARSATT